MKEISGTKQMPIIYLVGAKADLPKEERKVEKIDGETLAGELDAHYFEISAKNYPIKDLLMSDMIRDLAADIKMTFGNN